MLIRLLRSHLYPYRRLLMIVGVLQACQAAASLSLPTINARIIDNGVVPGDVPYIYRWGGVMIALAVVQVVFSVAAMYTGGKVAMSFGRDVRRDLFQRVTSFSAREVGAFGAPSLITRITNDVQQVQMLVVMACTIAIAAPVTMTIGLVMALREDVGLAIVLVVAIPIVIVLLVFLVSKLIPAFTMMQERIDQMNRILREQITGMRVVRAFVREPQEALRFGSANNDLTEVSVTAGRLMSMMYPTITFLVTASSVAVVWLGGSRIDSGDLQIGSMVAFLTYLVQILMAVVMGTIVVAMAPRASVAAGRIVDVLSTESSVAPPSHPVAHLAMPGTLELRDAGFCYPGAEHPVLSNVSFTTTPGRTTAIIGSTGAGKTTLVNLIARLVDVTAGSVLIGGVDVRDLDPDVLWGSIGLVPQKPYLFSGTVADNLQFGKPDATETEMWEALEVAQAADFVREMPGGLHARIEQGGSNVSGGQRQRLAIARALVRKPGIYAFDDSFSALDLATDARLRAALAPYTRDSAVVIVAQRVSTITSASEIIVLEDGVVVDRGTHAHLVEHCPTYAEIVESQIGEESVA